MSYFLLKAHNHPLVTFDQAKMPSLRTGLVTEVLLYLSCINPTQNYTFYEQLSVSAA